MGPCVSSRRAWSCCRKKSCSRSPSADTARESGLLDALMEAFTGTRPVAEQHAFDVPALAAYLRDRLPGFSGPLTVEQFKAGQSNPTYKLNTPGTASVVRAKPAPAAELTPSAAAIARA